MRKIDYNRSESICETKPILIDSHRFNGYGIPITGEYQNLRNWPSQSRFTYWL